MRIAPLTRREARAARLFRDRQRQVLESAEWRSVEWRSVEWRSVEWRSVEFELRLGVDELLGAINAALAEYESRPWWRRWIPGPPAEGDRQLRDVLIESRARLQQRVDVLDTSRHR
jgi:hypothetical protein